MAEDRGGEDDQREPAPPKRRKLRNSGPLASGPFGPQGPLGGGGGGIRLQSLIVNRWIAVLGQLMAVLYVGLVLRYDFPMLACLAMIGASVLLNLVAAILYPATKRLSDQETAAYLAFDVVQLSVLLFLTGGLHNPFFILVLAPVAISASSLSGRSTLLVVGLTLVCVSVVALVSLPLPWPEEDAFALPPIYQLAVWLAVTLGTVFVAVYARRIASEAQSMSEALMATQFVLAREQRLSAVGGLAAAAAHELGTPLGTIALIANDLAESAEGDEVLNEDVALMLSQVERCRKILRQLSADPHVGDEVYDQMELGTLLHELVESVRGKGPSISIHLLPLERAEVGQEPEEPVLARRPEILYALSNFLNNSLDFARSEVSVTADWTGETIRIEIADDGPGFSPAVLERLGEPYFTTRPKRGVNVGAGDHEGLGLGVFIATTLIRHTGGKVSFDNRAGGGALVRLVWAHGFLEQDLLVDAADGV